MHPIGRRIAEQEQVDRPPAPTDEREHGVVGLGRGGDELVGQGQTMVGVPRREEHMMGEREHLGLRGAIVELLSPVEHGEDRLRVADPIGGLGDEPGLEAQPPRAFRVRQHGERSSLQPDDVIGLGHRAVLVEPDPTAAERGVGEGDVVPLGLGHGRGLAEQRPGVGEAAARQYGPGPLDEQAGIRIGATGIVRRGAGGDGVAEELDRPFRRAEPAQRLRRGAARLDCSLRIVHGPRRGGHRVDRSAGETFRPRDGRG